MKPKKNRSDGAGDEKAGKLKGKDYEKELGRLHVELVNLQRWVVHKGLKVCVVFEGRDGAGKGGTIKAITERVSPRVFRVVALPAPTEREKSQMYVQRYMRHFPAAGEIVIFDRSWYNRAGVERVMGFTDKKQVRRFLKMVPLIEKAMVDSGILLIKYWLEVSEEEQTRRLEARIDDGRKTWKLSPWISSPTTAGTTIREHATRCLPRRTPVSLRGTWRGPTTSVAAVSTSSRICLSKFPTRSCRRKK